MIIGKFTQQGEVYAGNLYGIGFAIPHIVFSPVSAKQGNGPDFVITGAPLRKGNGLWIATRSSFEGSPSKPLFQRLHNRRRST